MMMRSLLERLRKIDLDECYEAADRIEQLEAENARLINAPDVLKGDPEMTELELMANEEARHGNREALERLEAELRGAYLSEMVALGQAQEAYAAQQTAEAKLAKAADVDLIEQCVRDVLEEGGTVRDAAEYVASAILAELTGGNDE